MSPPLIAAAFWPYRAVTASATCPAGTAGMVCATGGGAAGVGNGAVSGAGLTRVAPGDPMPPVSGAAAVACGATRLRTCADAGADTSMTATIAPAQYRSARTSHPRVRGLWRSQTRQFHASAAQSTVPRWHEIAVFGNDKD